MCGTNSIKSNVAGGDCNGCGFCFKVCNETDLDINHGNNDHQTTFTDHTVYVLISIVIVLILVLIAERIVELYRKKLKKYKNKKQVTVLSNDTEMDENLTRQSTVDLQNSKIILIATPNQKSNTYRKGMRDVAKINLRTIALRRQLSGEPNSFNPSMDAKAQIQVTPYNTKREIKRSAFTVQQIIGNGNFGAVFKGELRGLYRPNAKIIVAIKTMNDSANDNRLMSFLGEIKVMSNIDPHLNLVNMIGSCTSEYAEYGKLWLLLEFCQYGDLKDYLVQNRKKLLSESETDAMNSRCLIQWCYDIAKGMKYLARNQIMHGDLAARNVLIGEDPLQSGYLVAKVSDFGLSKTFYDNIKYKKEKRNYIPWKWMALEYLKDNYFTLTSDVWSFGIVVWEILSTGKSPYSCQSFEDTLEKLENGYRMPCPAEIKQISSWSTEEFYNTLSQICFVAEPADRATFTEVVKLIEETLTQEEINLRTKMDTQYESIRANNYKKGNRRGTL